MSLILKFGRLASVAIAACAFFQPASAEWVLAYQHDGTGVAQAGNLCNLKAAVRNGYDARVVRMYPGGNWASHEVRNLDISGNVVTAFAVMTGITKINGHWETFSVQPQQQYVTLDTTGRTHMSNIALNGQFIVATQEFIPLAWYVDSASLRGAVGADGAC